jgi:hypothetical protein
MDAETKPKRGRGDRKPVFKPTAEQRFTVSIAAGAGMFHADIAAALGVCRNTLEKHFEAELGAVAFQRRVEVLATLYESATDGKNVAAAKAYLSLEPVVGLRRDPKPGAKPDAKPAAAAAALGKKEQANRDAVDAPLADPEWADVLRDAPARQ